jgi:hypothetical protein
VIATDDNDPGDTMTTASEGDAPSRLIDAKIEELGGWRGETLARARRLIREADPDVVEAWKWRGVPVWEHAGIICIGETYKDKVNSTTQASNATRGAPSISTRGTRSTRRR